MKVSTKNLVFLRNQKYIYINYRSSYRRANNLLILSKLEMNTNESVNLDLQ